MYWENRSVKYYVFSLIESEAEELTVRGKILRQPRVVCYHIIDQLSKVLINS